MKFDKKIIITFFLIDILLNIKLISQDMEVYKLVFPQYPIYLDKLDSIKQNADIIVINQNLNLQDNFEIYYNFLSEAIPIANNLLNQKSINFKGLPISKSEFFLNDVRLNSGIYGGFDLGNIPSMFIEEIKIDKNVDNIIAGSSSLVSSIHTETTVKNNRGLNVQLHGGNFYGSGALKYSGNYKYFYWNTGIAYKRTEGYSISNNIPARNYVKKRNLANSDQEKASIFLKGGINDDNSDISFSYMRIDNKNGIPYNQIIDEKRFFLREKQWKMDLFNFRFMTELNDIVDAKGNFYYKKYKHIIDRFDDESFSTQTNDIAYRKIDDNYSFGANIITEVNSVVLGITKLHLNYARDQFKFQPNRGLELIRNETENLTLGIRKLLLENDLFFINIYAKYHLFNLIYSDNFSENIQNSYYDVGLRTTYINTDEFNASLELNKSSKMPSLVFLNDSTSGNFVPENSYNFDLGLKWIPLGNFEFILDLYYSILSEVFYTETAYLIDDFLIYDDSIYGLNAGIKFILFDHVFSLNYNYHISENNFYYFTPQNLIYSSVRKSYFFNFSWMIELIYGSERESALSSNIAEKYHQINVRFAQNISDDFEIYLRFDNITDSYIEYIPGLPNTGFVFAAGIRMNLGGKY